MRLVQAILLSVLILAHSAVVAGQGASDDWTQWRGPNRDGAVGAFTEPQPWPDRLTQQWKVEVGLGYATPLVVGERVYMFSREGENEVMRALDATSGEVIWEQAYQASFTMHSAAERDGPGPKSTPLYTQGRLYSIGMTGVVTALDAATGEQLWQQPGSEPLPLYTTHAFSPLLEGDQVVFHVGGLTEGALTAFDANTGEVTWAWSGDAPGYGSPVVIDVGGTRQIVTITKGKLVGVDAATGTLLWEREFVSGNDTNTITPTVYGETLIVSGNGGPTTALTVTRQNDGWVAETTWENDDIPLRMSDAVLVGDTLFGLSNRNSGQYFAVDARTGSTEWTSEGRQAGHAGLVRAGALVFSLEDDGELVVFRDVDSPGEPFRRYTIADDATWAQPVISGNRVFVKDVSTLALWTLN